MLYIGPGLGLSTQSEVTRETGIYTRVVGRVVVSNDDKDTSIVVG